MTPPPALRIHQPEPADSLDDLDLHTVAAQELLRPAGPRPATRVPGRDLEPLSRAWFEELDHKRYTAPGGWLRRTLEFSRHPDESLVVVGPGAGSDAVQYHRHGTRVTVCVTPLDPPGLARHGFRARNLAVPVVDAAGPVALPFAAGRFDLAYLNLLYAPPADVSAAAAELYRVLKPGGKAFVLAPARFDATYWQRLAFPLRHFYRAVPSFTAAPRYSAAGLRRAFPQFTEPTVAKRHLKRADLPHVCRALPGWLTERVAGRVLVLKAFKPVSAAYALPAAEAA